MILDIYRDRFSRIYIFSPSTHVDYTWKPVKDYIEKDMKVRHTEEEPIYFADYDPEALENIINTQYKIVTCMKIIIMRLACKNVRRDDLTRRTR